MDVGKVMRPPTADGAAATPAFSATEFGEASLEAVRAYIT
jgi:hypothetical protein